MDREEATAAAESWYQLPAEEDASVAMPTLSETATRGEHTDFPSLEEGTLLSAELRKGFSAGRTPSVLLEVQDSRLSPCLPLLISDSTSEIQDSRLSPCLPLVISDSTRGRKFFEDTLFQKTEVDDFAPLRASLDMSEFPGPPSKSLEMSDAVELASKEVTMDQGEGSVSLSQRYLDDIDDGGGLQYFSQQPLSFSSGDKDDKDIEPESAVLKLTSDDIFQPVVDETGKELRSEDDSFLSSSVPAPVLLKLLEKEVGMSSSSGSSSRRSSKSSSAGRSENVNRIKRQESEEQNLNTLDHTMTSDQSLESFRDSSQVDFLKDETEDPKDCSQLKEPGITLRQMKQPPLMEALHKQICSEIRQRSQDRDTSDATIGLQTTSVLSKTSPQPTNTVDDTAAEARLRDELSMSSRCSIERGHKDTEMSHTGHTPVDETSFLGKLPHPISQSTPGAFTMNRKPLSGRIQQIKAKLTGSDMSLNEEPSTESSPHNVAPSAVPQSIQSSQEYPESSDSQRSSSPQRRRIQSLPSLNYIEKVGAWNTNQSFDALVLRGLTGMSPKKLAYNAVADSLNRMFSRQASATPPKKGLSPSFKATSSMINLSVAERVLSTVSQITRSQSYNSVLPGRDQSEAAVQPVEEVPETTTSETSQSHVSSRGGSSTRENARKWVAENGRGSSVGGHDLPVAQTSSEFKEKSPIGQEKALDKSGNRSRNFVTMDRFSDVSSDQDYANSSQSSNHEKEILLGSPAKHSLTEGAGTSQGSPAEETSRKEELDIEERIPTYLRNLGINQSPTTILTPFAPKGPIRELEFSPSELRTIKGSTATPSRSMRLSEGGSQGAVNISQSSLYSSTSTTSVSIPMGSDIGPESPLPTEMSPPFGSDRPISQDDTMIRGVGSDLGALAHHVEMSPDVQPISDLTSSHEDNMESLRVKQLIEQFEGGGYDGATSRDNIQAPSLQEPPTMDSVNDSFIGSKTLKEIQKLLAEAEDVGLDRTNSSLHRASPVGDQFTESPPSRCLNLEDSLKSLSSRSASPLDLLVRDMSWDSSFNSSLTVDHQVNKDSSVTWNIDSLHGSSVRDHSYLGEVVGSRNPPAAPLRGRSEPEGCSKATTNKIMPSTNARGESDVAERVQRSEQLLSSVSKSVGGLKNALAVTGTGHLQGKETESDESSGDSLAARVTSLLKNKTPVTYTVRAEEEEKRARGAGKLRLTDHSMTPDTELSEEDRRRIEEIKRELLDGAKEADKGYARLASGDTAEFRLHLTPSPIQLPITSSHDFLEDTKDRTSDVQHNGRMTKESSILSDQHPPASEFYQQNPITELYNHKPDRQDVKSTEEATKPISSITFSSRKRSSPLSTSPDGGSQPFLSHVEVIFDKSTNQGFDLRRPPVPSVPHHVHQMYPQDLADKDADPTQQWRPGDSASQEFSASSWAVDREYSAAASIQQTPAPSVETFSKIPCPQKENLYSEHEKVNSEGSLGVSHSIGEDDKLKTYCGLVSMETVAGDGSWSQEHKAKPAVSSPTRKALSCIHVTISPKEDMKVLDVSKALVTLDTHNGLSALEPKANENLSRSVSPNLSRNDQVLSLNNLSAGTVLLNSPHLNPIGDNKAIHKVTTQFMGKENIQPERRRSPLSDATTQITTESPEKTIFSAEIFVEGSVREASTSSILKVNQTPKQQPSPRTPLSCLSRATDQPLLLPYRPPGSPELFYVPFMEGGSRMSPVSTIESSHPGSNDAISPKFPLDVLGSATEKLSDPAIPKHREGIYSKEPSPKTTEWKQKQSARGLTDDLKSSQQPLTSRAEKDSGSFSKVSSSTVHPPDPRGRPPYLASSLEDNEFLPLQPEIDYSQQQSDKKPPARSRATEGSSEGAKRKKTYSVTSSDVPGLRHKSGQTPGKPSSSPSSSPDRSFSRSRAIAGERRSRLSIGSNQSLDDLWARYTESRRQTTTSSNDLEMSLVERLERLARLLQNPPPRSLMPSKDENQQKTKKAAREQWYRRKLGVDSLSDVSDVSVGKPYEDSPDSSSLNSDVLSEVRSTVTDSATTESQVGSDATSGTGSSSVSTIDTVRLINAFGPERVLPSSRLSRLYSTIDLQKKRTEETAKGSKRASAGRGQSRMEIQELLKSKMADAESVTSSNSLWEPSPTLRQKKSSSGLNKGVQAGELEIVMSATRRNTRDVGTTFPSPGGDQLASTTDPAASVNMESSIRTSKSKLKAAAPYIPPGLSWFVPAEDLKPESQKENEVRRGPGLAWYEPVTDTKPWREPLREKNEQDQVTGRQDGPNYRTRVLPGAQDKPAKPFIKVTLQESLRSHRPDFIFRSRERVKRLQLLAEERKLQSVFQGERDELFNQPPRSRAPRNKETRLSQQCRTVPKKEMIQRSKRIYEQLPEIRKRKEEEKRRSEYETYRLKAQQFRKKVTNHILGRKTPWN